MSKQLKGEATYFSPWFLRFSPVSGGSMFLCLWRERTSWQKGNKGKLLPSWQLGAERGRLGRDWEQDKSFQNVPLVAYILKHSTVSQISFSFNIICIVCVPGAQSAVKHVHATHMHM